MQDTRGAFQIDLRRVLLVLWHRLWAILLVAALLGGIALGYAVVFVNPTYSSNIRLYVNNNYENSPGFSSSQLQASQSLAETFMALMTTRTVLEEVAKETELGYTPVQLSGMISAGTVNNTEIFQVTVTCENPTHAKVIANTLAEVLPARIKEVVKASDAVVVDYAVENRNPVAPSYKQYALTGAAIGAVLTALFLVLLEVLDTRITSEEYLAHVYKEYPLLAVIPGIDSNKGGHYKGSYEAAQKPKVPENKSGGGKK